MRSEFLYFLFGILLFSFLSSSLFAKEPKNSPKQSGAKVQSFSSVAPKKESDTSSSSSNVGNKKTGEGLGSSSDPEKSTDEFSDTRPPLKSQAPAQSSFQKEQSSKTEISFKKQIEVLLGDGRSVRGLVQLKVPPKIRVEHSIGGINYYKDIRMDDIDFIEVKAWKGRYLKRKPEGEVYRFEASRYVIHLRSGKSLVHRGDILPFLRDFDLSNENGKVRLYSYWLDLRAKEGDWYTGLKGNFGKERVLCHDSAIKKISFVF